jgi:hypothetical protein
MNRREALKHFAVAAGLTGLHTSTVKTLPAASPTTYAAPPALAVLEYGGRMTDKMRQNVRGAWECVSPFPNCKLAILEDGMRLRFYDAAGRERALEVEIE